jgi:oligosaccharide translocation protein RFT1
VEISEKEENENIVKSLSLFTLPIGILFTMIGYFIFYLETKKEKYIGFLNLETLFLIYSVGILIEIFNEPFYIFNESNLNYKFRIQIEGIALFCKMLVVLFFLRTNFLFGFCLSQILFSFLLIFFHFLKYRNYFQFQFQLDSNTLSLLFSFFYQTLLKFLLSEGEKFFLVFFSTLKDQGGEDLVFFLNFSQFMIFQVTWVHWLQEFYFNQSKKFPTQTGVKC